MTVCGSDIYKRGFLPRKEWQRHLSEWGLSCHAPPQNCWSGPIVFFHKWWGIIDYKVVKLELTIEDCASTNYGIIGRFNFCFQRMFVSQLSICFYKSWDWLRCGVHFHAKILHNREPWKNRHLWRTATFRRPKQAWEPFAVQNKVADENGEPKIALAPCPFSDFLTSKIQKRS